jgi:hypothetical protein
VALPRLQVIRLIAVADPPFRRRIATFKHFIDLKVAEDRV